MIEKVSKVKQAVILACCLAVGGCKQAPQANVESGYKVMTLAPADRTLSSTYSATIRGRQDIEIYPQVSGTLTQVCVSEGERVKRGQSLFVIDQVPYEAALQTALANVEAAKASLATAQLTYDSKQELYRQNVVSAFDLSTAKNSLLAAQAQLAQAELNLQDSTLIAPSDGTLLTRAVEPGTVLNEGGTVFTVSLTRPVWVRAYVDERNLDQAQPGRKVLLYTDGRPDKPYHGQIGFVSPTAEFTPKTVETPDLRTDLVYRLRIVVTDADDALRQGMPVTVQFGDEAGHE